MADNATTIRGIYEAVSRGDVAAVLAEMDERIEWNEAEHYTYWPGGAFTGPQAVVTGVFARIAQDLQDFRIDVHRIVAAGDIVLVEARYRGSVKAKQYTDTWLFAQVTGVAPLERALA